MGYWTGGDRDWNPFITAEITTKVAFALLVAMVKCLYRTICFNHSYKNW